jgi:hypothetical protein
MVVVIHSLVEARMGMKNLSHFREQGTGNRNQPRGNLDVFEICGIAKDFTGSAINALFHKDVYSTIGNVSI